MDLIFRVKTHDYLVALLHHLGDKGCTWIDGDSLYDEEFIENAWVNCNKNEVWIFLRDSGKVSYGEVDYRLFHKNRKVLDCDTVEELLCVMNALKDFHQDKDGYSWI